MEHFKLITEYSAWLLIPGLLVAAAFAWLLYARKAPWGLGLNRILAALRFILVGIIALMLLNPLLKQVTSLIEKPFLVFAIDNSESVAMGTPKAELNSLLQNLDKVIDRLKGENINVAIQTFDKTPDKVQETGFKYPVSDISKLMSDIETNYENRNLGAVVLLSDGIYNQGVSPAWQRYGFPVYSLGAGDTIPKKDVELRSVQYNKIAYLGNKFPIKAEVKQTGYAGKIVALAISQNGKLIESKVLKLPSEGNLAEMEFLLNATNEGPQHYLLEIKPLEGEFTERNNLRHIYLDVINGKEKILLLALAPHPDLKAIKSAIEAEQNYQLSTCILGVQTCKDENYDLVILHQLPDMANTNSPIFEKYIGPNSKTPVWFITGLQSSINRLNSINNVMRINPLNNQPDKVGAGFNEGFGRFVLETETKNTLQKLPPLSAPFANYQLGPGAEVLLNQQLGSVNTGKPLLAINTTNGNKQALLAGEGLWEWRLQEFSENGNHKATDELIRKIIQYLTSKEDKRKFRVYPIADNLTESERIIFATEVYNDIYEKIYNQKIDLKITSEEGKVYQFSFVNSEQNGRFDIGTLPHGVYKYEAFAQLGNKTEKACGEFIVREIQLEVLGNTADHALLREISAKSGGQFFKAAGMDADGFGKLLLQHKPKDIVRSFEETNSIINLKWIFFVLLALVSTEWFLRKINGSY